MKKAALTCVFSLVLAGCAHHSYSGSTGSSSDTTSGAGTNINDRPHVVNDLDDLGYTPTDNFQKANGQSRIPGRSVDLDSGTH